MRTLTLEFSGTASPKKVEKIGFCERFVFQKLFFCKAFGQDFSDIWPAIVVRL